jgi:micrococcal nuclease
MIFKFPKATILKVVDGDTFDARVDTGFSNTHTDRFRMIGINTPETRGIERPQGLAVKEIVTEKLLDKDVVIETHGQDSFGRWLCVLWLDDVNINEWLLNEGYARVF